MPFNITNNLINQLNNILMSKPMNKLIIKRENKYY